jgi:hypothetical protein
VQHKESLMDHLAQVRTKAILQERKFRCQWQHHWRQWWQLPGCPYST